MFAIVNHSNCRKPWSRGYYRSDLGITEKIGIAVESKVP